MNAVGGHHPFARADGYPWGNVFRLIYTSRVTTPLSRAALERLLINSRAQNLRDGITGILCHWGSGFAQCLEGERPLVLRTVGRIARDTRHRDIEVLLEAEVPARHFGCWSMHLVTLDESSELGRRMGEKYPRLGSGDLLLRDPLVIFSLLFDLGLADRAGLEPPLREHRCIN